MTNNDHPNWSECPVGAAVVERLDAIQSGIEEIKRDVKAQNGRVRKNEINKVDWSAHRDLVKKVDGLSTATTKIVTIGSVIITLLSLGLLAYKTIAGG